MQPRRNPPPPQQVRVRLERSKLAGVPWPRAWHAALNHVTWDHNTDERKGWKLAMAETEHAWRSAYEDQPDALAELTRAA